MQTRADGADECSLWSAAKFVLMARSVLSAVPEATGKQALNILTEHRVWKEAIANGMAESRTENSIPVLILWVVKSCGLTSGYQRFVGAYCLSLQGGICGQFDAPNIWHQLTSPHGLCRPGSASSLCENVKSLTKDRSLFYYCLPPGT
jgi:hypothetical protein